MTVSFRPTLSLSLSHTHTPTLTFDPLSHSLTVTLTYVYTLYLSDTLCQCFIRHLKALIVTSFATFSTFDQNTVINGIGTQDSGLSIYRLCHESKPHTRWYFLDNNFLWSIK